LLFSVIFSAAREGWQNCVSFELWCRRKDPKIINKSRDLDLDTGKAITGAKLMATLLDDRGVRSEDRTVPDGLLSSLNQDERDFVIQWLESHQGLTTLGILMRMDRGLADALSAMSPSDPERLGKMLRSAEAGYPAIESEFRKVFNGGSPWSSVQHFPGMHSCAIRAPADLLAEFLGRKFLDSENSPVAGILVSEPVRTPECVVAQSRDFDPAENWEQTVQAVQSLPHEDESAFCYLTRTEFEGEWTDNAGAGRCVCILDSGADESHPALRQQVKAHAMFDGYGNYKEAVYCVDRGCHGSKVSGRIAGKPVQKKDLGIPEDGRLRLGIAPGAKIVMVNVLEGECLCERATLFQLLAGGDWAVRHRQADARGGYEVVNISMEPLRELPPDVTRSVDVLLHLLWNNGLIPILAAGNDGPDSRPIGTRGVYVGATDQSGVLWPSNGGQIDLLAPGVDVLLCQPAVEPLGYRLLSRHSGTSYAAATVSGIIVGLCQITEKPARNVLDALLDTAESGVISLNAAYKQLIWAR
jgi:subtilisin family serine protease